MLERREGTGESKVGLAGEVAMGDGVGREERPSKTPAYEEGKGNGESLACSISFESCHAYPPPFALQWTFFC